ncbi:MAG: hypothetical protein CMJ31_03675 [Phycisphaerae bacterium]|nr:hypothetical protein [Phycisphaerae bacterium]
MIGIREECYDEIEDTFQMLLSYVWIDSHCHEYDARIITNIPYLGRMDCGYRDDVPEDCFDFPDAIDAIKRFGLDRALFGPPVAEFAVLARSDQWTAFSDATGILEEARPINGHIQLAIQDLFEGLDASKGPPQLRGVLDGFERSSEWLESGRVRQLSM